MVHIPVLQKEVIQYLNPGLDENFVDCTFGGGGHAVSILEKNKPNGKLLGIEIDSRLCQDAKARAEESGGRLVLINDSYVNLKKIIEKERFQPVSGILFDLGISSWHLEESGRGFSFQRDEPLDMRYHSNTFCDDRQKMRNSLTGEEILNKWSREELEKILREYGEERFSLKIAKAIIAARRVNPIKNTLRLAEIIKKAVPRFYERGRIHPATRTFQALRIAVNGELENINNVLPQALDVLKENGRLVVISFHSLEDRIVKNFFRESAKKGSSKILTKKPVTPSEEEIRNNPRSRSAKLRALIKTKAQ